MNCLSKTPVRRNTVHHNAMVQLIPRNSREKKDSGSIRSAKTSLPKTSPLWHVKYSKEPQSWKTIQHPIFPTSRSCIGGSLRAHLLMILLLCPVQHPPNRFFVPSERTTYERSWPLGRTRRRVPMAFLFAQSNECHRYP